MQSYEKRIIGFIDILGFGQLVFESENESDKFLLIQQVLQKLNEVDDIYGSPESLFAHSNYAFLQDDFKRELNEPHEKVRANAEPSRVKITTFSDSIVFSCPADSEGLSNFRYFLIKLLVYTNDFQLLLRGGVSCGSLVHTDQIIFGPAMNHAYHVESKVAKHPRIAIDDYFKTFLDSIEQDGIAAQTKRELIYDQSDSVTYFDSLSLATNKVAQNMCEANAHQILINEKNTIEALLHSAPEEPGVRAKLEWYASYFNQYLAKNPEVEVVVTKFQGMPFETIMVPVGDLEIPNA